MSLRSSALRTANTLRGLASTPALDIYTTRVVIRTRTWTGGRIGTESGYVDDDVELLPRPKVREVSQREIAGSGGTYEAGDVRVGPITPAHPENPGVGYTKEQLAPVADRSGVEIIYALTGGVAGDYKRIDLRTDRAFSWWLTLRRKRSTP